MISKTFWAITSYFNPSGYKIRRENYKIFRKYLNVPLIAIELSFNGKYELESSDADILIRIKGKDIMWQKERLLNIALNSLPENCKKVAWVDCDMFYQEQDWAVKTSKLLDKYKMVQPFRKVHHLPHLSILKNKTFHKVRFTNRPPTEYSFAFCSVNKAFPLELHGEPVNKHDLRMKTSGIIWAIRKEIILHHKFYDSCIIGGGDTAMAFAACGRMNELHKIRPMNQMQNKHYLEWAEPFYKSVNNEISFLDCDVSHLWHGPFRDRNYGERHKKLKQFNFNPYTDIKIDQNGCLQWSQKNTKLSNYLASHFSLRNEDAIT